MTKQEILEHFKDINHAYNESTRLDDLSHMLDELVQSNSDGDKGEISDGYHTFNQLYHQRAVLFATIVNQNQEKAWKSFKHSDGQYCFDSNGEWFIVGVDTPDGSYTYHYAKEYWDMFHCKELKCGKEWDGHTEEDVTRLLTLESNSDGDCISRTEALNIINFEGKWIFNNDKVYSPVNVGIALTSIKKKIKELPSIQSKAKMGHWIRGYKVIEHGNYAEHIPQCKCSECGYAEDSYISQFIKYCSNCGARMEE